MISLYSIFKLWRSHEDVMYLQLFKNIFGPLFDLQAIQNIFLAVFSFFNRGRFADKRKCNFNIIYHLWFRTWETAFRQNQRINEPNASNFMNDLHQGGCGGI